MTDGHLRPAEPADAGELIDLIRELAVYEREPDIVDATPEDIRSALFGGDRTPHGRPALWCNVIEHEGEHGELGGMVMYFLTFSTWTGKHGIHIEDLIVRESLRGTGYGARLLDSVADECVSRGYPRLEWAVLDWNQPAIDFYERRGAGPLSDWITYRLDTENPRH